MGESKIILFHFYFPSYLDLSIPQIFKSCIIEEVDFWRLFMILEQIDKDLLKMAEESDVILKDIYKKLMMYVYTIQIVS